MINGTQLRDGYISAANNIANQKASVDALNVFPVPDGDTGTNMSMTIQNAAKELAMLEAPTVAQASKVAASALLRGARGNSGVILSLLFRGFSKGLAGKEEADGQDIAHALQIGVESAYKAVMKPTEGTILTVARLAAKRAAEAAEEQNDPVYVFGELITAGREALQQTPELLPVLKKAGVVDAGGRGFIVILEGMYSVLRDGVMVESSGDDAQGDAGELYPDRNAAGEYEGEITFTYCTEFIVTDRNDNDPLKLRAYLESIGDCVVVVDDEEIIKCHVHTDNPGKALQKALEFGMLTKMKIENMREQHATQKRSAERQAHAPEYVPVDPERKYGVVAVVAGEGLENLFKELGADQIVSGGQTMNPSTDDILKAIHATPAQVVYVLPNNKNIIMAAEQTKRLADREVRVLQTRTVPQGVGAMLAFDPDMEPDDNQMAMSEAADHVQTGQITFAARDSEYDGHRIKEGELLCMENGKLSFVETDLTKAAGKLVKSMLERGSEFVTVYTGIDVTPEQAAEAEEAIRAKIGSNVELTFIDGGQPVYYFIIAVE